MNVDQLKEVLQCGHTVRYHTAETTRNPMLSEHIYGVLIILDHLYSGNTPPEVYRAALFHDAAEYHTGDLPHPFKQMVGPKFNELLDRLESDYIRELGLDLKEVSAHEVLVIKLADILEMGFFAAREIRLGNTYAWRIMEKVEIVVRDIVPEKVRGVLATRAMVVFDSIKREANNECE